MAGRVQPPARCVTDTFSGKAEAWGRRGEHHHRGHQVPTAVISLAVPRPPHLAPELEAAGRALGLAPSANHAGGSHGWVQRAG